MKIYNYILTAIFAIMMIASCETAPSVKNVTLLPSSSTFNAGVDTISFTVQYGEEDVTADAQVFTTDDEELTDKKFSTSIPGDYSFYAIYNNMASLEVSVTALGNLELIVDKTSISADGDDFVTFTVMQDGIDVTSESTLYLIPEDGEPVAQDGFTFSTTETGTYNFYATKGTAASNTVEIIAFKMGDNIPSSWSFKKRSFIVEITSTGCVYCPYMKGGILQLEQSGWDNGYVAEVHGNMRNNDPMTIQNLYNTIAYYLPGCTIGSFPFFNWNFDKNITVNGAWTSVQYAASGISQYTNQANAAYDCTSGAVIAYNETDGKLTVSADIAISETGNYKVNCWILEDNIYASQVGANYVPEFNTNNHMNVVRALTNTEDVAGSTVHATANQVENFTWTFDTSSVAFLNNNLEDTHVYVVISKEEGTDGYIVNNIINCEFNSTTEYEYAE